MKARDYAAELADAMADNDHRRVAALAIEMAGQLAAVQQRRQRDAARKRRNSEESTDSAEIRTPPSLPSPALLSPTPPNNTSSPLPPPTPPAARAKSEQRTGTPTAPASLDEETLAAFPKWAAFAAEASPSRSLALTQFRATLSLGAFLASVGHSNRWLQDGLAGADLEGAMLEWAGKCALPDDDEQKIRNPNAHLWDAFLRRTFRLAAQHAQKLGQQGQQGERRQVTGTATTSEAERLVHAILALKTANGGGVSGGSVSRFIPKSAVQQMGRDVLRAYERCGGATKFLAVESDPDKLHWLVKDFARHLADARATPDTATEKPAEPAVTFFAEARRG